MTIAELLTTERVIHRPRASSKKRALETLSQALAQDLPDATAAGIFDALIQRERLGSTGLGHGVALPHCRTRSTQDALGAILILDEGLDYEAPDNQPVDLLFALLVPEAANDEHLALLVQLAEMFSNDATLNRLRATSDAGDLIQAMRHCAAADTA